MPQTTMVIMSERAARLTSTRTGAPRMMPTLLPLTRLLAAGVLKSLSISRRRRMPEEMVPVIMPYMEMSPS